MKGRFVLVLCLVAVAVALIAPAVAGAKPPTAPAYKSTLTPTNKAVVSGTATMKILYRPMRVKVTLVVWGLEGGKPHDAAICGFADGRLAKVPTPAADTNHDGLISGPECRAVSGDPVVWLTPFKRGRGKQGAWVYSGFLRGEDALALDPIGTPLTTRVIVVSGVTQMPTYTLPFWDPDAPAACGAIKSDKK